MTDDKVKVGDIVTYWRRHYDMPAPTGTGTVASVGRVYVTLVDWGRTMGTRVHRRNIATVNGKAVSL